VKAGKEATTWPIWGKALVHRGCLPRAFGRSAAPPHGALSRASPFGGSHVTIQAKPACCPHCDSRAIVKRRGPSGVGTVRDALG